MIPITRAATDPRYARIVAVMATQMGKTANLLNVIGRNLDDDPAPILYFGPTKSNVEGVIEPQVQQMLRQCPTLWAKALKGRRAQKLIKRVSGVTLRLAWAGSATELASQPARDVLLDEIDRMEPIPGEGDVVTLAEARIATYPDGRVIATSSPTEGNVDVSKHPETGIEHWDLAEPEDISSQVWKLWQEGTRYEWAVPCPHCGDYFVPRFRLLTWPEGCTPHRAEREARLACPGCGGLIGEGDKTAMNEAGTYLAPGQKVEGYNGRKGGCPTHEWLRIDGDNGRVVGDPPESETCSMWVSGIMSPWVTFGQRASSWLRAVASGDQERIRGVLNTRFGELYHTRGQAPPWEDIRDGLAGSYQVGDVPAGAQWLFLTVDVQKDRLVCTVRAWGAEWASWLVHREELWGETDQPQVWERLDALHDQEFGGRGIRAAAVDTGYRAEQAYEWCRRHRATAYATKGRDNPARLYSATNVEVKRNGKRIRSGLKLWTIDHSYFKGWVHDRLNWPADQPGAWLLPSDIDEDYCRQLVAEQRMRLPSGRVQWITVARDNHYLDCEAMQAFLAHVEGVRNLRPLNDDEDRPRTRRPGRRVARSSYLGR